MGSEPMVESAELADLLDDVSIGEALLSPIPRGGMLTGASLEKVERALEAIEARSPGPYPLVYGNGCFAVGRYADAAEVYSRILEREPESFEARFNLSLAYLRLQRPGEAAEELTAVLRQEPALPDAYYQRGNAYDELGTGELALADYSRALELGPDYLQAVYNRGVVLGRLGRHQEAVEEFGRAIALRPEFSNAYLNPNPPKEGVGLAS